MVVFSCHSEQEKIKTSNRIIITKTLSQDTINAYNLLKEQGFTKNDTVFKLEKFDDIYIKSRKIQNFIYRDVYNANTLKIERSKMFFANMPIGVHKTYDKNGKITEEDYDKGFSFTVIDLISKLNNDLGIDLNNIKNLHIGRDNKSGKKYIILIPLGLTEIGYHKSRHIEVNGRNGKIIEDKIAIATED